MYLLPAKVTHTPLCSTSIRTHPSSLSDRLTMSNFYQGCESCVHADVFKDAYERAQTNPAPRRPFSPLGNDDGPALRPQALIYGRYAPPSCASLAVSGAVSGAAIGGAFGGAMALSQAGGMRMGAGAVADAALRGAVRNAAGFAMWSGLYRGSRCTIARYRRRDDAMGAAAAGAFTGGALSLVAVRGAWRYNRNFIAYNAAASAVIAVVFSALSGL